MSKNFTTCRQCGENKCTITKADLLAAGLPASDKKVTTRFCSIKCHDSYIKRQNLVYRSEWNTYIHKDYEEWFNFFHHI